jgi:hypothetical protein
MPAFDLSSVSGDFSVDFPAVGAIAAIFVFAGLVKGLIGLGLPTVAMGLLGSFMPAAQAATLLIVPSLATNMWQTLAGKPLRPMARRLWSMQAGSVAGTLCAPFSIATLDGRAASGALGLCLLAYATAGLVRVRLSVSARHERWLSPCAGLATGVVTAATGVFVLPAVPYLQGLRLGKDELVQALGLSFTVSTLALAGRLASDGSAAFSAASAGWGLALPLSFALLGMSAGQRLRRAADEATFKRLFFLGLGALGAQLVIRSMS